MTLKLIVLLLSFLLCSFGIFAYRNYLETGGFEENTDEYDGYRYFTENNITDPKNCEQVDKEYDEPASKEWMIGCKKFLEMNK